MAKSKIKQAFRIDVMRYRFVMGGKWEGSERGVALFVA